MKVTALKQQVKNKERVSVFVDARYAFSLTLSQLLEAKLKVGVELDEEQIAALKQISFDGKLYAKTLNWALLRPRSMRELSDYLKRQVHAASRRGSAQQASTQEIFDEIISKGYVNDVQFAQWWVGRSSRASKSRTALMSELMGKGVARDIITEVLESSDDAQILVGLITKLRLKNKYQDPEKLMRYLASKGFNYSSIKEALGVDAE